MNKQTSKQPPPPPHTQRRGPYGNQQGWCAVKWELDAAGIKNPTKQLKNMHIINYL